MATAEKIRRSPHVADRTMRIPILDNSDNVKYC